MRKKIVSIMALSLVATMGAASLTGCGTQAKATDIIVEDGDTIIVDDEDTETAKVEIMETETTDETAITSTEVIDGSDEAPVEFAGAEDDNIVLYAEIAEHGEYLGQKDKEFNAANGIVVANEDVPIYNGDGIEVGYIKNGGTVSVTEYGLNAWSRFENPIAGTGYDYLYVLKDYVTDGDQITITIADAEEAVKEELSKRGYDAPTFVSNTDGMEMYEFRIPSVYANAQDMEISGPNYYVDRFFSQRDENTEDIESIRFYKTYVVVCSEDTDDYIICQVYYKDVITEEEWKAVQGD